MTPQSAPVDAAFEALRSAAGPERFASVLGERFCQALCSEDALQACAFLAVDPSIAFSASTKAGHSCLFWACASESLLPVLEALLSLGSDVEQRDDEGLRPLEWAVISGNAKAVELLSAQGSKARPPLLVEACRRGDAACALALVRTQGFDPWAPIGRAIPAKVLSKSASRLGRMESAAPVLAEFERMAIDRASGSGASGTPTASAGRL